jgi:hypothetical protein
MEGHKARNVASMRQSLNETQDFFRSAGVQTRCWLKEEVSDTVTE